MTPRLSVIVPTHERPALLEKAWESLAAQSFGDFEALIVDDASADATPEKIAELARRDPRVRGLRLARNAGPGAARNAAIAASRGELVALLDDDDLAAPERFARQVALFAARPEVGLLVSAVGWMDGSGEVYQVRPGLLRRGELPEDPRALFRFLLLEGNYLPTTALMARREALAGIRFLEGVRAGEDWFFFLQATALGRLVATQPEPLVRVLREPGHASLMADKGKAFAGQRRALAELRCWLRGQGLAELERLWPAGLAQQYLREARYWGGLRAAGLCLKASLTAPGAPRLGETWRWLAGQAGAKLRRAVG